MLLLIATVVSSTRRLSNDFPAWRRTDHVNVKSVQLLIRPKMSRPCLVRWLPWQPSPNVWQCSSHKESFPLFQMYLVTSALRQRVAKTTELQCHRKMKMNLQIDFSCPADAPLLFSAWTKIPFDLKLETSSGLIDIHPSNGSCVWTSADQPGLPRSPEAEFHQQPHNRGI